MGNQDFGIEVSPFYFNIYIVGGYVSIEIVKYMIFAYKLLAIYSSIRLFIVVLAKDPRLREAAFTLMPFTTFLYFTILLLVITLLTPQINLNIPLIGSEVINYKIGNIELSIPVKAGFTLYFLIAFVAAILNIIAYLLYRRGWK